MPEQANQQPENEQAAPRGPLDLLFPVDPVIWRETRRLITDKTARVEAVATCASQDPALVLDLLRVSNAMFFSGGRAAITSVKTSIVRLGSDVVVETLEDMKNRPKIEDPVVANWFELFRGKCRRTSIVSRIVAEACARQFADDCQTAGLLISVGEMLAVMHFQDKYVALTEKHARSGVNYQLSQYNNFNVEQMGLQYLRKFGIPEILIFAIDRDARPRSPDRAIMRPACLAASELVDAFDDNRWERLAPGRTLPPKSNVRMLQLSEPQYLAVYERSAEYLFSARLSEERRSKERTELENSGDDPFSTPQDNQLAADIQSLIEGASQTNSQPEEQSGGIDIGSKYTDRSQDSAPSSSLEADNRDQYSLQEPGSKQRKARAPKHTPIIAPPELVNKRSNSIVNSITACFDDADSSEDLLITLLERLIDEAQFEKAALIVVSKDRDRAIVVAARGPSIGNGQQLQLDDPLSPLAQCFSKVQSFGNRKSKHSPFGSKSFALSPIDVNHDTPVALYADCGNEGSLTFESRRVFRTVVDILNQKLPSVPGGLPVELETV